MASTDFYTSIFKTTQNGEPEMSLMRILAVLSVALGIGASGSAQAITVTSFSITGPHELIQNGPHGSYVAHFAGTDAGNVLGTSVHWSIYEIDPVFDDTLIGESNLVNVTDDATGKWSLDVSFELWCQGTNACYVTGKDGADDEKSGLPGAGHISPLLEGVLGGNKNDFGSYGFDVRCVPEPSMYAMLGAGLVGLMVVRCRKHRLALLS